MITFCGGASPRDFVRTSDPILRQAISARSGRTLALPFSEVFGSSGSCPRRLILGDDANPYLRDKVTKGAVLVRSVQQERMRVCLECWPRIQVSSPIPPPDFSSARMERPRNNDLRFPRMIRNRKRTPGPRRSKESLDHVVITLAHPSSRLQLVPRLGIDSYGRR